MARARKEKRSEVDIESLQIKPAIKLQCTRLTKKSYDSLTVLVPGTLAALGIEPQPPWYQPSDNPETLFTYLKDDVFQGQTLHVHAWNTLPFHASRVAAAKDLLRKLAGLSIGVLRIIGHSHGANVATMATRNNLLAGVPGLRVRTLVLLSPAVGKNGDYSEYYPQMSNVGDPSVPVKDRRFFTFHPPRDTILGLEWAHDYQQTSLRKHETLCDRISNNADHWASTYSEVWRATGNRLADLIRNP